MTFAKSATPAAAEGASSGMLGYAKYALIGIASAIFLFFTTRALRRREQEGIDNQPPWLRELELPVRLSELEREIPPRPAADTPTLVAAAANGARCSDPSPGGAARGVQPRSRRPAAAQLDAGGLMVSASGRYHFTQMKGRGADEHGRQTRAIRGAGLMAIQLPPASRHRAPPSQNAPSLASAAVARPPC